MNSSIIGRWLGISSRIGIPVFGLMACAGMISTAQAQFGDGQELDLIDKVEITQKVDPSAANTGPTEFFPRLSKSETQILKMLDAPTEVSFHETPLTESLIYLSQLHKIEIWYDEVRIDQEIHVTLESTGSTLRSCLNRLLEPRELAYLIEDDVLKVTTKKVANAKVLTRTYPVSDLIDSPDESRELLETLLQGLGLMQSTDNTHAFVLTGKSRVLVVRQTHQVHDQLLQLLRDLREAAAMAPVQATDLSGTVNHNPPRNNGTDLPPGLFRDPPLSPDAFNKKTKK